MSKTRDSTRKLRRFQGLMTNAVSLYQGELNKMPLRQKVYNGDKTIQRPMNGSTVKETDYVNNMAAEMIESQVSPDVPQPKVTALRKQDEWMASLIEDYMRLGLQRMNTEEKLDLTKEE